MGQAQITDAVEVLSADPARRGRRDLLVSYTIDEARFYTMSIPFEQIATPEDKIDPEKVQARIREEEAERKKLIGEPFEV